MYKSLKTLTKLVQLTHVNRHCKNTFSLAFVLVSLLNKLSPPLSYPHPLPPLPHSSWAHSLLVTSICSHVAGILLCQEYSLPRCIVCHLSTNKQTDVVLVFGFWRCTVPSKKWIKIKTLLHESSPKIIFILCLAPYLNPAFSHLHQPSLSDRLNILPLLRTKQRSRKLKMSYWLTGMICTYHYLKLCPCLI